MAEDDILTLLGHADELYRRRAEPEAVEESIKALVRLKGVDGRYEVQWRLARALFFMGQEADSVAAKRLLHKTAITAGECAARLNPRRVEGRFWLGVNLALFAESAGGIRGALALLRARRELQRAASISEDYHGAGPLRVLGRLHHKAPRLLGGSRKQSRRCFDRALAIAPENSVTLLYASELAIDCGERDRAARMLEKIIGSPPDQEWEFENHRDRRIARDLLKRLQNE
ncbi:MAG: TRAP transporter TatT component family protein [Blastocatellia bacterium]|nr:TRAP transporter TatT component family protein [Blastocatellia bacterium]